jgi:CRP/FNR family transcriptional regulator, anaerobic regulatory protein
MDFHIFDQIQNPIIKKLCHAIVQEFNDKARMVKLKSGQNFIVEGTLVQGLFLVKEGIVKVSKTGLNGREQLVRISKAGEIVGYRGFGTNQEYQVGAETITDTELFFYSNQMLEEALLKNIDLTYSFMLFYAQELSSSETKVRKFAQMTVREKVIDSILYIHRKFGQDHEMLNLQLSRKEVASLAGTTDEQVIRVITSLVTEGLLTKKGVKIGVKNLEKLKREIAEHNFFISS